VVTSFTELDMRKGNTHADIIYIDFVPLISIVCRRNEKVPSTAPSVQRVKNECRRQARNAADQIEGSGVFTLFKIYVLCVCVQFTA
jgi:hypothetical protein